MMQTEQEPPISDLGFSSALELDAITKEGNFEEYSKLIEEQFRREFNL